MLEFIHALNDSPILYIETAEWLKDYDPSIPDFAFEVYSCFGEIKVFRTWSECNEWRVSEIRAMLNV
jgi:hypothetical protein